MSETRPTIEVQQKDSWLHLGVRVIAPEGSPFEFVDVTFDHRGEVIWISTDTRAKERGGYGREIALLQAGRTDSAEDFSIMLSVPK